MFLAQVQHELFQLTQYTVSSTCINNCIIILFLSIFEKIDIYGKG